MRLIKFAERCALLGIFATMVAIVPAHAQATYPDKPIRFVVPFPPGGGADNLARAIVPKAAQILGQPIVIENKPGAGGNIGAADVARAAPDGYTLLQGTNGTHGINQALYAKTGFDPVKDFVPVARFTVIPAMLVVHPSVPATNVKELVAYIKANPGKVSFASAGSGTPTHLTAELFRVATGIQFLHVPYKGAAPALLDVIAGNAQLIITSPIAAGAHMSGGRVRALATTGAERNPGLPELPTIADAVPGYEISQSWGIAMPAGTPPEIVKRLSDEIVKAMSLSDVQERVLKTGAVPVGDRPAAFEAFMAKERQRLGEVITKTGIVLVD